MSRDFLIENVRSKLTENGIKLWTSPYFVDGMPVESEIDTLGDTFCGILGIEKVTCIAVLNELQQHSLDKLRAKEIFESTGIASLKVRCPGGVGGTRLISVNIKLTDIGEDLQKLVAEKLETSSVRVKLISNGKVLDLFKTLDAQNVRNNQQLMALLLTESEQEAEKDDKMYDKLRKIREDALTLINSNKDRGFMHMEDQKGNPIVLPLDEKRAIMLALALHEKARTFLKKEQYSEALILLLDADKEWGSSHCASDLLQTVDNYALLNLDIVWCYLILKSVMQLPDAERRLKICEDNFKRSYGANFDRVQVLKGSAENEKALIMRLHLMQAVLFFHQNRKQEAFQMLQQAEIELNGLRVNNGCLEALIEMGYSSSEARIALRSSNNNIDNAITHIQERRQQKNDARNAYKEQQGYKKFLGKNVKDAHIKTDLLSSLVEMGFRKELAVLALSKADNNISEAITMLQDKSQELKNELSENIKADSNMIETLVSFGFTAEMAKMALKTTINNQNAALDYLLKLQSEGNYDTILNSLANSTGPSTSSGLGSTMAANANALKKKVDEMKVYKRFTEDISSDEDSYLDLPLQTEEKLINDYKKFLNM